MPTTLIWRGSAQRRTNVWHLTPANPEPGDVFTISINRIEISYTAEDGDGVPEVVAGLISTWNASTEPEVAEITASSGTDEQGTVTHVVLTHDTPGVPFIVAGSTSDAGDLDPVVTTVQHGNPGQNEIQRIALSVVATGGTFTLTFQGQTTAAIAFNADAATVEAALEALSNIAAGDVIVSGSAGGPWLVEFTQAYANTNVALMSGDGTSLTGGHIVSVQTDPQGTPGVDEVQRVDISDVDQSQQVVFALRFTNELGQTSTTADIQHTVSASQFQAALESTLSIGVGNVQVTQVQAPSSGQGGIFDVKFVSARGNANQAGMVEVDSTQGFQSGVQVTEQVAGSSSGVNEVQTISLATLPTSGTFTLTFEGQTTGNIAWNADAATVKAALDALSNITAVSVTKPGDGTWIVTFDSGPTGDVGEITGTATNLAGGTILRSVPQEAIPTRNEIQEVAMPPGVGGGTYTLANDFGAGTETTGNVAFNASAATLQTALIALTTPVAGDLLVSGPDGGPYLVEYAGNFAATDFAAFTPDGTNLTGGGTQDLTESEITTATGPNWWNEPDNWLDVAAPTTPANPANGDKVYVQNSRVPILYGLEALSAVTLAELHIAQSFEAAIGLPEHNGQYFNYLPKAVKIGVTNLYIGEGNGSGSPLVRIDTQATQTTIQQVNSGQPIDSTLPAVQWIGTHASNAAEIKKGSFGAAVYGGQTATLDTLKVAYDTDPRSDANVVIGHIGGTFTLGSVEMTGGEVTINAGSMTSIVAINGLLIVNGEASTELLHLRQEAVCEWNSSGEIGEGGAITAITAANPAEVTSNGHGQATGTEILITAINGMIELNERRFVIENTGANTFELVQEDSTGHTTYVAGGVWEVVDRIIVADEAVLDFSGDPRAKTVHGPIEKYGRGRVRDLDEKVANLRCNMRFNGELRDLEIGDNIRVDRSNADAG